MPAPSQPTIDSTLVQKLWVYLIGEPEYHFKQASDDFAQNQMKSAAFEIMRSSAFLQLQAVGAEAGPKKDLDKSADLLEQVATDIRMGSVTSSEEMDNAFARAQYALANDYQTKASSYFNKKDPVKTGYALDAAAQSLLDAEEWSSHKLAIQDLEVIEEIRKAAGNLVNGRSKLSDKIGMDIGTMGKEIQKFESRNSAVRMN